MDQTPKSVSNLNDHNCPKAAALSDFKKKKTWKKEGT